MEREHAIEVLIEFAMQNPPESIATRLVLADAIAALGARSSGDAAKVALAIRASEAAQLDFFRKP